MVEVRLYWWCCSRAANVHSSHHRLEPCGIRITIGTLRFLLLNEPEELASLCFPVPNERVDVQRLAFYRTVHIRVELLCSF
jgi:hypothetical protein